MIFTWTSFTFVCLAHFAWAFMWIFKVVAWNWYIHILHNLSLLLAVLCFSTVLCSEFFTTLLFYSSFLVDIFLNLFSSFISSIWITILVWFQSTPIILVSLAMWQLVELFLSSYISNWYVSCLNSSPMSVTLILKLSFQILCPLMLWGTFFFFTLFFWFVYLFCVYTVYDFYGLLLLLGSFCFTSSRPFIIKY